MAGGVKGRAYDFLMREAITPDKRKAHQHREHAMITRKAFKKWLLISILCGAHSFFWGVVANGHLLAMALGTITLAAGFAAIESHRRYQMKREASPSLARALDAGVKLRCWLALAVICSAAIQFTNTSAVRPSVWVSVVINAPLSAEIWIGAKSMEATKKFTGLTLPMQQPSRNEFNELENKPAEPPISGIERFFVTYIITLFTGLAHTVILGFICLMMYGVIRLRGLMVACTDNQGAANS